MRDGFGKRKYGEDLIFMCGAPQNQIRGEKKKQSSSKTDPSKV
jgi:hypothetical protein